MRIIVNGATGRMGKIVTDMIEGSGGKHAVAARVSPEFPGGEAGTYQTLAEFKGDADVVIDFTHHTATAELLAYCTERKLPLVLCTTGQTEEERAMIAEASKQIPIFFSANMSIGVALLADLARRTAATFPNADIEIVETHHNQKLDVPSGTALIFANSILSVRKDGRLVIGRHENGKRDPRDIGVHSLRLGTEVGTHEIIVSTGNETVTLKHQAINRTLFAEGALTAASFHAGKPAGMYDMKNIVG